MRRLHTEKKLINSVNYLSLKMIAQIIKNKQIYDGYEKLSKRFIELFIIIRCALQENSGVRHMIRDFVDVHRKGLQSVR